jgi:hypothetical protein
MVRILREKLLESSDSATTSSRRVSAMNQNEHPLAKYAKRKSLEYKKPEKYG